MSSAKLIKKTITGLLFSLLFISVSAQVPAGYYYFAKNKKKADLKTALRTSSTPFYELNYGGGQGFTWEGFYKTDNRNDTVIDMYSTTIRKFNGFAAVSGMHIEHSLPKSWWGGHENMAYKDLFHLYPADGVTNSTKSDLPLGEVTGTPILDNGMSKIGKNGFELEYTGNCFEPADEYKGDFARSYFYISTVYETLSSLWQSPMMNKNTWPVWKPWAIDLLLKWSRQDPVSAKELARQEVIYNIQGNRNPFIDYPDLAEYIWGADTTKVYPFPEETGTFMVTPRKGYKIDFGVILKTDTKSMNLHLQGVNLFMQTNMTLSHNLTTFTLSKNTLLSDSVKVGTDITITFSPTQAGEFKDTLTISGAGLTNTLRIPLKGLASADFITLEPDSITPVGGVLQWIADPQASDYKLTLYKGDQEAGDLIISGYVEGSSWNKAIQLYNGTSKTLDLSKYYLQKQSNGLGSFTNTLKLSGTLAPATTYTIVHKSAGSLLMAKANLQTDTLLQFNGNDAVRLVRSGVTIDMVGIADCGADIYWGQDVGLKRKADTTHPKTQFSAEEWDTFPIDTISFLSSYTMNLSASAPQILVETYTGKNSRYKIESLNPLDKATYVVEAIKTDGNIKSLNSMQINTSGLDIPVAYEATNVTANGFTAEWELSPYATSYALNVFQLSGVADTTETEHFDGVGTNGQPLPTGWTGTASGNYTTDTSSGLAAPSIGLKNNGEWLQTKIYPYPVTQLTFMYRFPSAAIGSSFILDALSGDTWKRVDSVAYKSTTAKTYPVYNFDKQQNYTSFRFTYKKSAGNLAVDDVQTKYGQKDTLQLANITGIETTSFAYSNASQDAEYYYKVAAERAGILTGWSDVVSVRTSVETSVNTLQSGISPKVRSFNDKVLISDIVKGDRINVYNISGSSVLSINASGDSEEITLKQKGIYIIHISGNEYTFATKIVK